MKPIIEYDKREYLTSYQLTAWASIHQCKMINTGKYRLYTHSFLPKNREGMVTIIHGYLDHAGSLNKLIHFLLSNHFGVISFDLPGHGYSNGNRGDIDCFSDYTSALHTVQSYYKNEIVEENWGVIGHSTGAAIVVSYLQEHPNVFKKVILAAPLIQPYLWSFSQIGVKLIGRKVKHLNRAYRRNSSNDQYLQFVKSDPLQFSKLPMNWLQSFHAWHKKISNIKRGEKEVHILQGNKDTTVDWRHNVRFLLNAYPNSKCILIDGVNHQLFNEEETLREIAFFHVKRILAFKN
ncbi:Phospholipase YtpA [Bacillus sp. THAF10]|uniref:alpha/beta hydrolase n=1 Tax=Bacillus sp. THAF10 TaxID=2587848 RepID=UPI0012693E79|nr:alpha/beta hydrolase [Bacillus sp. THAF10]QFT89185.1 Phospholipase YtpA [Bacillus sp. THAF10]